MISLSAKIKGGQVTKWGKMHFGGGGGRQEFLADGVAGGAKTWACEKNLLVWLGSQRIFCLNQKQKSYVTLELVTSKFLKNPFETNVDVRNTFTWDGCFLTKRSRIPKSHSQGDVMIIICYFLFDLC